MPASGRLHGKVALVTGGGRGIGREIVLKLASEGARVVVNDLDAEPASSVTDEVRAVGGEAIVCAGSVTDDAFADRFVTDAVSAFGGIDIVVNNAGYTWDSVVQKMSDEQWDTILDLHLRAPFRLLRAVQPVIATAVKRERSEGLTPPVRKVVNVSSLAGTRGNAGQANYAAAKAGVIGLTKALAKEWGRYDVTVNAVAFGLIRTRLTAVAGADQASTIDVDGRTIGVGINPELLSTMEQLIPLGRAGTPQEAAGAVYLLCSPESDYVSGQTLLCGGGYDG